MLNFIFKLILEYYVVLWFLQCLYFVTLIVSVKENIFKRGEFYLQGNAGIFRVHMQASVLFYA